MRFAAIVFSVAVLRAADSATPLEVTQQLFDAVLHKDAARAQALFTADAVLTSVKADGSPSSTPATKWVERMAASKDKWEERIWNVKQMEQGTVAHVWADYDFHLAGKFSHCGIDSFSLLKTTAGWKIAFVADTREKEKCAPSPLGPPK